MGEGRTVTRIPVATLSSGGGLELVLHEVVGRHDGPTLGLAATIHGDEMVPIEVIRRVLESLDTSQLRGRIVALPVANPQALETFTRNNPLDMTNLNRVFPGKQQGATISELLAAAIVRHFVSNTQCLVDFHSGGAFPTIDLGYMYKGGEGLAYAFSHKYLCVQGPSAATLTADATRRGVPSLISELGGGGQRDEYFIEMGCRGVTNTLRYMGMLPGAPDYLDEILVIKEMADIRPRQGGVLLPAFGPDAIGTVVPEGTALGTVIHSSTFEPLEHVTAPFASNRIVMVRGIISRVNPGDYAFMLGNEETLEVCYPRRTVAP